MRAGYNAAILAAMLLALLGGLAAAEQEITVNTQAMLDAVTMEEKQCALLKVSEISHHSPSLRHPSEVGKLVLFDGNLSTPLASAIPAGVKPPEFRMVGLPGRDTESALIMHNKYTDPSITAFLLYGLSAAQAITGTQGVLWLLGMHTGWQALSAASLGFKTYGFEPLKENQLLLAMNTECFNKNLAQNIQVIEMALWDRIRYCHIVSLKQSPLEAQTQCEGDSIDPCNDSDIDECIRHGYVKMYPLDLVINNELPPHVGAVLRVNAGPHESAHILKGAKETLAGQYAPLLVSTPILYGDLIGLSAYMHEQGYVLLTRAFLDPPTCEKPSRWEFRAMSLGEGFEIDAFDITRAAVEQGWTGRTPEQLQAWLLQEYPDMDMSRPTLRDRGMMYNRIWGGMLLRVSTEVLFAKPEILPLLPGAPKVAPGRTVKAMHGGLFGEDLSAVLGEQVARDTYLGSDVLGVMLKGSKGPDGRFVQACTGFGG